MSRARTVERIVYRMAELARNCEENQMVELDSGTLASVPPAPGSSGPVKPIRLKDGVGVTMELRPKSDITTLENAHLMVLMFKLTLSQESIPPDWQGYIRDHGLGRHFVTIEPNEDVGA